MATGYTLSPRTKLQDGESRHQNVLADESLLDKEKLRRRLGLKSVRGVDELIRRRKIPVIRLGHRTVRFSWPAVQAAISRFTIKEIQ
jgi:hypothetical protein